MFAGKRREAQIFWRRCFEKCGEIGREEFLGKNWDERKLWGL
jgi:hypothetical protein